MTEIVRRCASYARAHSDDRLATQFERLAVADPRACDTLDALDAMFSTSAALYRSARVHGWEEEYVGLAAAYFVEADALRA